MVEILISGMAAFAILQIWFFGSIFDYTRARCEVWEASDTVIRHTFGKLMTCRLCLGTWVCLATSLLLRPEGVNVLICWFAVRAQELFISAIYDRLNIE